MINYQKQPNSQTCGQTTIAMIAGIDVQESIKLFGHNGTSYYKDYTRVLGNLGIGFIYHKVDNRKKIYLPKKAIIRIKWGTGNRCKGHLVAYENGVFYDPLFGVFYSKEEFLFEINRDKLARRKGRIDWYLEILESKPIKYGKVAGDVNDVD